MKVLRIYPIALIIFTFLSRIGLAQNESVISQDIHNKKGKLFIYWGWNRASYSHSDISFRGDTYDFKLSKVIAKDRQTPFDPSIYFNLGLITIPQTNFKIGYFFNSHFNLSVGVDHMKYVMVQNQTVKINGTISTPFSPFEVDYNNNDIVLTKNFLTFEHTDGLNYINVELSNSEDIIKWVLGRELKNLEVNMIEGVGMGILLPKTNAKLFGQARHDDFHLSGYGLDAKLGLNITFFKYFFFQGELKGGFIHMPDIRTTQSKSDKASQSFVFCERDFLFGVIFQIAHSK